MRMRNLSTNHQGKEKPATRYTWRVFLPMEELFRRKIKPPL
jgi:hypothetical protein